MTPKHTRRKPDNEILLVGGERSEQVRDQKVLRDAGYRVSIARTGLHAQQLLASREVALVITEQQMPAGIDGIGLLIWVKARYPKTRRVILTARPRGALVMDAKMLAGASTLIRPLKPEKLLAVVKEELDAYAE